ncbi:MAG: IS66 family transposase [Thermoplasmata archaeon]
MAAALQGPWTFGLEPEADDDILLKGREYKELARRFRQLEEEIARLRESEARKAEEIRRLRDRNRQLDSQLRALRSSALVLAGSDRTAEAGSMPTSRVFYRRTHRTKGARKPGGKLGHPGRARPRPVPNSPPLNLSLDQCRHCGTPLGAPASVRVRTITELPEPQPLVFDVVIPRYHCPGCHRKVEPEDPYPRFFPYGPRLVAEVLHLRLLGLSIAKIARFEQEARGIPLSTATILRMERSTAEQFDPTYRALRAELLTEPVVGADETGFRVGGGNGWLWAVTHPRGVVYRIAPSRGHDIVDELLDGYGGTIVRDAYAVYDRLVQASHQLDLLHVNRWLEQAEVRHRIRPRSLLHEEPPELTGPGRPPEEFLRFADGVRRILRGTIVWSDDHPETSLRVRRRVAQAALRAMTRLVSQPWTDEDAVRIAATLKFRRPMLFTFLTEPGVPWNNNDSETQVRQGVLYRKISGGRRSWTGAWVLERLLTIYRTCQKRGLEFITVLKEALTSKSAPILTPRPIAG